MGFLAFPSLANSVVLQPGNPGALQSRIPLTAGKQFFFLAFPVCEYLFLSFQYPFFQQHVAGCIYLLPLTNIFAAKRKNSEPFICHAHCATPLGPFPHELSHWKKQAQSNCALLVVKRVGGRQTPWPARLPKFQQLLTVLLWTNQYLCVCFLICNAEVVLISTSQGCCQE